MDSPYRTIKCYRSHQRVQDRLFRQSARLQSLLQHTPDQWNQWSELIADIFQAYYQGHPSFRQEITPKAQPNKALIQKMMQSPDYHNLRKVTALDEWQSGLASLITAESLRDTLNQAWHQGQNPLQSIMQAMQHEADNGTRGDVHNHSNEATPNSPSSQADEHGDHSTQNNELTQPTGPLKASWENEELQDASLSPNDAQSGGKSGPTALDQALDQSQQAIGRAIRDALSDVKETFDDVEAVSVQWGVGPGELTKADPDTRFELAETLTKDRYLQNMAEWIGRSRRIARGLRSQEVYQGVNEIVNVTTGRDPELLLTEELGALRHPTLKRHFYARFLDEQTLQYELKDRNQRSGRGPIVALMDTSQSTKQNGSEFYIKGVGLALASIAQREGRSMYAIIFSSEGEQKMWSFTPQQSQHEWLKQMVDVASSHFYGGTDFEKPLALAQETIMNEHHLRKADIVLLTDGQADLGKPFIEDFNAWRDTHDIRLITAILGTCASTYVKTQEGDEALRGAYPVSDVVLPLDDFSDYQAVEDVIKRLR